MGGVRRYRRGWVVRASPGKPVVLGGQRLSAGTCVCDGGGGNSRVVYTLPPPVLYTLRSPVVNTLRSLYGGDSQMQTRATSMHACSMHPVSLYLCLLPAAVSYQLMCPATSCCVLLLAAVSCYQLLCPATLRTLRHVCGW